MKLFEMMEEFSYEFVKNNEPSILKTICEILRAGGSPQGIADRLNAGTFDSVGVTKNIVVMAAEYVEGKNLHLTPNDSELTGVKNGK